MKLRRHQSGMSVFGMLIIGTMAGFFAMCGIKMIPIYLEYQTVKKVVTKIATNRDSANMTLGEIRRQIATNFNTNQIYALKPRDVEVFRKDGKTYIDSSYEVRIPMVGIIDAIMSFNDLKLVVGPSGS